MIKNKNRTITLNSLKLDDIIFTNQIIIVLFLFPFFKTSFFSFIPGLSLFCNIMLCLECVIFFIINIVENKTSIFSKVIFLLHMWTFLVAPIISKYNSNSFFYFCGAIAILSFYEIGFRNHSYEVLKATSRLFTVMTTINCILVMIRPDFLFTKDGVIYLFGLRTGFSCFIIPGIVFNLVRDCVRQKRSLSTILIILAGVYSLILEWVVTGIIGVIILFLILLIPNNVIRKINIIYVTIFVFIINFSMTIALKENNVIKIIASLFGKDITISGRTEIWLKCINKLSDSFIAGMGENAFVNINGFYKSAHNQWLQFAFEGGIIALVLAVFAILVACVFINKNRGEDWYKIVISGVVSVLVVSIVEVLIYTPYFYILFELPFILLFCKNNSRELDVEEDYK